ncbi:MAG: aspartate 1-decarboxylase [Planctomycetaceae bacterium]|nr:aspartate 1-decarboxylase [Planctomycetaceae bacterium]
MQRILLKSKIHRATLTATDLHYEGSITIDAKLLRAADILPGEQVHVLNLNNGSRLITYAIEGPEDSGLILLNGPAARSGMPGDMIVVLTYAHVDEKELAGYRPTILTVDETNKIKGTKHGA